MTAPLETIRESQTAILQRWCNGCKLPAKEWGPVCSGMTQGDYTHFHSAEWWVRQALAAVDAVAEQLQQAEEAAKSNAVRLGKRYLEALADAEAARVRAEEALRQIAAIPAGADDDGIKSRALANAALAAAGEGTT